MSDHKITGNKSQQHGIRLSAPPCKRRINKQSLQRRMATHSLRGKKISTTTHTHTQQREKQKSQDEERRWGSKGEGRESAPMYTHTRSAYRRNKKKRQKDLLGSFSIETQRSNLHYRGPLYCLLLDCRLAYIYINISITCCPVCMCGRGREERKKKKTKKT